MSLESRLGGYELYGLRPTEYKVGTRVRSRQTEGQQQGLAVALIPQANIVLG
jgi:hypothetical protein